MPNLGPWLAASFSALAARPGQYGLMGLAWFGAALLASLVIAVPFLLLIPVVEHYGVPWLLFVAMIPAIAALWTVQGVSLLGLHGAIDRLLDEGQWSIGDLVPMDRLFSAAALSLFIATLSTLSVAACMLPLIPMMGAWGLAMPVMAAEGTGPLRSLSRSWELSRDHFGELCLYFLIAGILFFVVSYIPLVGPFLAWPVMTVMSMVPYRALASGQLQAEEPVRVGERDPSNPYQSPREV